MSFDIQPPAKTSAGRSFCATAALLTILGATPLNAQKKLLADYPLLSNLNDSTANNGPVTLRGNPTPPAAPSNGVCTNGISIFVTNGQEARTATIPNLDATDFQLDVDFKLNGFRVGSLSGPVLMGGIGWRWIGIHTKSDGTVGIKYNNSNYAWSTTKLVTGQWYVGVLKFENGTVQLHIDGVMVHTASIGVLNTGAASQLHFTTMDGNNQGSFNGCIRNVRLWNDTCLTCGMFTRFTTGCAGLTITEGGTPNIGGNVTLDIGGPPNVLGFLVGVTPVNFPWCSQASCALGLVPWLTIAGSKLSSPIPNSAALVGFAAYFQGLGFAASGGCSFLAFTDTVRVGIGR
jgi:hypothetical protein